MTASPHLVRMTRPAIPTIDNVSPAALFLTGQANCRVTVAHFIIHGGAASTEDAGTLMAQLGVQLTGLALTELTLHDYVVMPTHEALTKLQQ